MRYKGPDVPNAYTFFLNDHLGSTTLTVLPNGYPAGKMLYKAFGEQRHSSGTTPTDYRYTGQLGQADIGLYYYGARWYDPALGRFTQADTIIPQPGNPLDWDRYGYVRNNPIRFIDPSGNKACDTDNSGTCHVDTQWLKSKTAKADVALTPEGQRLKKMFEDMNQQAGWWNNDTPGSMTMTDFIGIWIIWEGNGNTIAEEYIIEAVGNQLWFNNRRALNRNRYCTEANCNNAIWNYMAVQGGGHHAERFLHPSQNRHPTLKDGEDIEALVQRASSVGYRAIAYDPTRPKYDQNLPWNWGNNAQIYTKIADEALGLQPNQIAWRIYDNFILFTIGQMINWQIEH